MAQSLAPIIIHLIYRTKNREPMIARKIEPEMFKYQSAVFKAMVKKSSSRWLKSKGLAGFQWQAGYGAFSLGESGLDAARVYVQQQKEHHCRRSFQVEFRAILRKYRIEFDERYVWD